jgi:hypothetical protein
MYNLVESDAIYYLCTISHFYKYYYFFHYNVIFNAFVFWHLMMATLRVEACNVR